MKKKIFVLLLLLVLLLSPFFGFVSSAAGEVGNEGPSSFSESLSEKKPLPDEPGDIENVVLDANGQPLKPDGVETEETNEGQAAIDTTLSYICAFVHGPLLLPI